MEVVSLPVRGGSLSGDYLPGSGFAVVWVHGFGSHRGGEKSAAVRDACRERGWAFAAFDFHGHGESSGTMLDLRASCLIDDLNAVSLYLLHRGHTRLGLVGSSMGGFASAWFALRRPQSVVGCAFVAPGFRFLTNRWDRLTEAEREEWRRTGRLRFRNQWVECELGYWLVEERDAYRPEDLAAAWNTPALIFHGMADEVVPADDSLDFVRRVAYPGVELRLFKDGDHRLTAYKDEIAAEACRFFARLIA